MPKKSKIPGIHDQHDQVLRLQNAAVANRQLSSLLIAILRHTGPVVLSKAEAEVAWEGAEFHSQTDADGNLTLWVDNEY